MIDNPQELRATSAAARCQSGTEVADWSRTLIVSTIYRSSVSLVGEKVHICHLFCKFAISFSLSFGGLAWAGDARNPQAFGQEFMMHIEAQSNSRREPAPKVIQLPVTVGAFLASDWYVYKFQGKPCHIPTGSLLTISLLSERRMIGTLQWPYSYRIEGPQCADRQAANDGICFNSKPPQIPLCYNGTEVIVDWSGALNEKGQLMNPTVTAENIRAVLASPKVD